MSERAWKCVAAVAVTVVCAGLGCDRRAPPPTSAPSGGAAASSPAGRAEVATRGSVEVTARLVEIPGVFPPNKLYDYMYVLKYQVLKVHRGSVEGDTIFVAHYNPLKARSVAADKFVKEVGGTVERFEVGQTHHMALEPSLDTYMGGIIDKYFGQPGVRYRALWTDYGRP